MAGMTPKEYFRRTSRTWNRDESFKEQIDNAVLGIIGEVGEFTRDPDDQAEAGDIYYYLATFLRLCGEKPATIDPDGMQGLVMTLTATLQELTQLAEHTKKWIHHGKADRKPKAVASVKKLVRLMLFICQQRGWEVNEIWGSNIAKLEGRFPKGFEADNAPD